MSKRLHGGSSDTKKAYYGNGPTRIPANKRRRIVKHLKAQPNDNQSKIALEKLGGPKGTI